MADETTTPTTQPADNNTVEQQPQEQQQRNDEQLGEGGKKALDAERRARREAERQLQAVNTRLQEIADQGKSDLEKATERAAKAEQQLAALQGEKLRFEVAAAKGLPYDLANRLQGGTRDELEADADTLIALLRPAQPAVGLRIDPPAAAGK